MTDADKIVQVLAEHSDYAPDDDSSGDVCAGCFAKLDPDGDSHAGSLAGLRKHQAAVVLAHLTAEGWAQGREERTMRMEAFDTPYGPGTGSVWYRRRVTDWEPADA